MYLNLAIQTNCFRQVSYKSVIAQLEKQCGDVFGGKLCEFEPHWGAVCVQGYDIQVYH